MDDELARELELLTRLERAKRKGEIDGPEYAATKTEIQTEISRLEGLGASRERIEARRAAERVRRSRRVWLAVVILAPLSLLAVSTYVNHEGDDQPEMLRESEAEVLCERMVRERIGGRPSFSQGENWESSNGWVVNGMVSFQGRQGGYSCEVTGRSGSASGTLTYLDW